ncbi:hypothetical protein ASE57_12640 [Sphingomonas sp. Leaf11]|nr:hypothetical protein ASE58_12635 [Sphingomonas sp. Leaf9]KQM42960.1 hypothetical protein ASE57_12640 [Sphingomonas sp. Leaf11]
MVRLRSFGQNHAKPARAAALQFGHSAMIVDGIATTEPWTIQSVYPLEVLCIRIFRVGIIQMRIDDRCPPRGSQCEIIIYCLMNSRTDRACGILLYGTASMPSRNGAIDVRELERSVHYAGNG